MGKEGAAAQYESRKRGRGSAEALLASPVRNSHQAQVQIFSPACENKSFSDTFPPVCLSLHGPTAASETPLYLPRSTPSMCFDIGYLREGMCVRGVQIKGGLNTC